LIGIGVDIVLHCPWTFTWATATGVATATMKTEKTEMERNSAAQEMPLFQASCFKEDLALYKAGFCRRNCSIN
jgi:hypothetical protein